MNQSELVKVVSVDTGQDQESVRAVLESALEVMTQELASGNKVRLNNFCTLSVVQRGARTARNPQTGEPVPVPARRAVAMKPLQRLRDRVRG